jgi:hypothetical protein
MCVVIVGAMASLATADEVERQVGECKVKFPAEPKVLEQPLPPPATGTVKMLMVDFKGVTYIAGDHNMAPGKEIGADDAKRILDGGRDGAVANTKGKLISEKTIELAGKYPGREIVIRINGPAGAVQMRQRFFLVGTKLYQVVVVGQTQERIFDESSTAFLNSLKVAK